MLQLPPWHDGNRALTVLAKGLAERGLTYQVQDRMQAPAGKELFLLPGFCMFDCCGDIRASQWCVPKPRFDADTVVSIYEEYVDRDLGFVPVPDRVARQLYGRHAGADFFGPRRAPDQWWLPAAQLIAIAGEASRRPPVWGANHVKLELPKYILQAGPQGCWSNTHGRMRMASKPASDADTSLLRIPVLITEHPLGAAVANATDDQGILWAANSVVRAEVAGNLQKVMPRDLVPDPLTFSGTLNHRHRPKVAAMGETISRCKAIVADPVIASYSDLYSTAVPKLLDAVDFFDILAHEQKAPDSPLTAEQCARFSKFLEVKEQKLLFA